VVRAFVFYFHNLLPPRRAGPPLRRRGTFGFSPTGGVRRQPEGGAEPVSVGKQQKTPHFGVFLESEGGNLIQKT